MTRENTLRFIRKNGLRLWIAVAVVVLSGMLAFAAYTNQQNKAKKVIATSADTLMCFSSNYLEEGTTKVKTIVVAESNPSVPVTIRNNSRTNPTVWYSSDVVYNVIFSLTDTTGSTDPSVIDSIIGSDVVTITYGGVSATLGAGNYSRSYNNQTLTYNSSAATTHTYSVLFPSADSQICVRITATPSLSHPDLAKISAILSVTDQSTVQTSKWDGSFSEKSTTIGPSVYDAYNYSLIGSGDSNSATFKWKPDKLEVNKQYFYDHFRVDVVNDSIDVDGWRVVTIPLNTAASGGRYDFQLFKVYDPNEPVSFNSWSELEQCVEFDDGI